MEKYQIKSFTASYRVLYRSLLGYQVYEWTHMEKNTGCE